VVREPGLESVWGNLIGTAQKGLESVWGNLIGTHPTDVFGSIIHALRHASWNPLTGVGGSSPQTTPYETYLPKNAEGLAPENYQPNNEQTIRNLIAGGGKNVLALPNEKALTSGKGLSDQEYTALEKESANGNPLAMKLLTAFKPQYGPTGSQYEQQLAQPFVNELQQLPSLYTSLEQQTQQQEDVSIPSALAQADKVAAEYSGVSPQAPNAQTESMMSQYGDIAANVQNAVAPIMTAGLKDLGDAAEISLKTFPYTSLISDLLNRYAYQVQSPYYPPPAMNWPGLSPAIQKLFQESTGSSITGANPIGNFGLPSANPATGALTIPGLQPGSPSNP
jgi:hypothetical protein